MRRPRLESIRALFASPLRKPRRARPEAATQPPPTAAPAPSYSADGVVVYEKSVDFLDDPRFRAAYWRGMDSGHHIARAPGSRDDVHIEWRVHVLLWAASHAAHLPGDFVECGVNTGIFSLAVCDYVDFNATGKTFWLFDTFSGIPADQVGEREHRALELSATHFGECFEVAKANFRPYPRARLVRGKVPDTLGTVPIGEVAYLSLDMNIVKPEIAALEFFWDKLTPGAPVVLDDYAWEAHRPQKEAIDAFAAARGVEVLTVPTGQGLLLRPPG